MTKPRFDYSIPFLDEFRKALGPEADQHLSGLRRVSMHSIRGERAKDAIGIYDPVQHQVAFKEGAVTPALVGHELAHAMQRGNGHEAGNWAKLSSYENQVCEQEQEADLIGEAFASSMGSRRIPLPTKRLSRGQSYAKRELYEIDKSFMVNENDSVTFVPHGLELRFRVLTANGWKDFFCEGKKPATLRMPSPHLFQCKFPSSMAVYCNRQVVYEPPASERMQAAPARTLPSSSSREHNQQVTNGDPWYGRGEHSTRNPVDSNAYYERKTELLRRYPYWTHSVGGRKPDDDTWADWLTVALDIIGLIPVLGGPADVAAACIHFAMGEPWLALLSLLGLVPILEWGLAGVKALVRTLPRVDAASIARLIPQSVATRLVSGISNVRDFMRTLSTQFSRFTADFLQAAEDYLNALLDQFGVPRAPQLATAGSRITRESGDRRRRQDSRMHMEGDGSGTGPKGVRSGFRFLRMGGTSESVAHGGTWQNLKNMFEGGIFYPDSGGLCFFAKQFDRPIMDTFKHGVDKPLGCAFAFKGRVNASGKRILEPDDRRGGYTDVHSTIVVETSEGIGVQIDEILIRGNLRNGEGTVSVRGAAEIKELFRQLETRGVDYINTLFGRNPRH